MKGYDQTLEVEITIDLVKGRSGHRRSSAVPKVPDPPRIPRITRLMALAVKFQDMIDREEVRDYADLARLGYVSRARITQIMNLLNLAPDIQEELLSLAGDPEVPQPIGERHIRRVVSAVDWRVQRQRWSDEKQR